MEFPRLLDCLAADEARLREVAATAPTAPVPSCPDWSVTDLVRHVAGVYLHKTACMREGREPEPWPPAELADEEPFALLDRAYTALLDEFTARAPKDHAGGWYGPDQTVGFLIRRMAQETVVHRVDAELGAGVPVTAIPDDLGVDGIDELLKIFVAYGVSEWSEYFTEILADSPGRTLTVRTEGAAWTVRTGPGRLTVDDGPTDGADAVISGTPDTLLRWLWNRLDEHDPGVTVEGDPAAVAELRRCIVVATQ